MIIAAGLGLTLPGPAGPVKILDQIDLEVAAGETVALVGPSGSGKTSLLMLLAGLERASAGDLVVAGARLGALDEEARAAFRRQHVGIVFQSFHLMESMTALENVALPLELAGQGDAWARAQAALESVGLGARLAHRPGSLSGGEQQRVALARAFVASPALLLADEPTGNLDQATGAMVMALLFGLQRAKGTTLILVTHDGSLAANCQRVLRLADGRIAR